MKIIQSILLSLALLASPVSAADTKQEAIKAGAATVGGAALGYGIVATTGVTAVGVIGGGAGIGSAAGPIGTAIGALVGLAGYGVYCVLIR